MNVCHLWPPAPCTLLQQPLIPAEWQSRLDSHFGTWATLLRPGLCQGRHCVSLSTSSDTRTPVLLTEQSTFTWGHFSCLTDSYFRETWKRSGHWPHKDGKEGSDKHHEGRSPLWIEKMAFITTHLRRKSFCFLIIWQRVKEWTYKQGFLALGEPLENLGFDTTWSSFPLLLLKITPQTQGLKQHKFVLFQFWRSEVQNPCQRAKVKVPAGEVPSGGWESLFSPFSASRGRLCSWGLTAPSSPSTCLTPASQAQMAYLKTVGLTLILVFLWKTMSFRIWHVWERRKSTSWDSSSFSFPSPLQKLLHPFASPWSSDPQPGEREFLSGMRSVRFI